MELFILLAIPVVLFLAFFFGVVYLTVLADKADGNTPGGRAIKRTARTGEQALYSFAAYIGGLIAPWVLLGGFVFIMWIIGSIKGTW